MPVVTVREMRNRYQTLAREGHGSHFCDMIFEAIGLQDSQGRPYFRDAGDQRVRTLSPTDKRTHNPGDFKFDKLAEAIIGPDWRAALRLGEQDETEFPMTRLIREHERRLSEEGAVPLGPSPWQNVAAWSATVGGLMQAQFNLGYETAKFEFADLFPIRPAVFWQGGERYIDIIGPYQPASAVGPGIQYPDNGMAAMWVQPGPMVKYAGQISLTKELLAIDISGGQILARANNGGWSIRFRENELSLDAIVGSMNNFALGFLSSSSATTYNTYGPTIAGPAATQTLTNDILNPLNDTGAFQISDQNTLMYHPVTNNPIDLEMDTILLPTPLGRWGKAIMAARKQQALTVNVAGPAQQPPGTFPSNMIELDNPWDGVTTALVSRWLDERHVASATQTDPNRTAGLGLSGPARYRWYRLNPRMFACRRQMWAATSQAVNATDFTMLTQGIAAAFVWDIATMVQVLSPYHIQRNRGA